MRGDQALTIIANQSKRVEAYVREGVERMFEFAERSEPVVTHSEMPAVPEQFHLKGINKRGMAQSKKRR